ncbi:MAG TPA: serine/threonine dehydratase [Nocardioides sp.]|uniref:serine/threonine dehydratase n=1 Tax=Nocardioides sp. TaxID=35761 RepID=UPI002D7E874F|nr:serine/threonine dehydratase [Nocardioides sp.]HET6654590.1 serine/threonine dehydratase [Nocardioides sp.]
MTLGVLPSRRDVEEARARVGSAVRRTPVLEVEGAELGAAGRVVLKLELLQHAGSFKARGAMNNVLSLPAGAGGVAAASGGNHGVAVAWAAASAGLVADVFAPASATPAKLHRIEEYGARLHPVDGDVGAALDACREFSAREGMPVVHPYDTFATVSGAGTLGLELAEQVPDADRVVIACGGGGLYAGVATALDGVVPVQPVEPELCPHLHHALAAGAPVAEPSSGVAADALGPPRIGEHAFAIASARGATVPLVSEDAIVAARSWLWQKVRVLAEPAASVPLAAVMSGLVPVSDGETVVLVVSGGNNATLP